MAVRAEGLPCWADAMFRDVEAAKRFYADVLGWTYSAPAPEYCGYVQAYVDGKAVAAVSPSIPGMEGDEAAWCLYFASPDLETTARRVREAGGHVLAGPMDIGDLGSMLLVRDPAGVVFGAWRARAHEGFDRTQVPGAFAWAEILTREADKSDAFFPAVFPYRMQQIEDADIDFRVYTVGDDAVLGRMRMTAEQFPPEVPSYLNVYFSVDDCDAAVARATEHGGTRYFGPMDTPFGRFATLGDPQGAAFSVVDVGTTTGEMPRTTDVT